MMKAVILNAPANSGKDCIAEYLTNKYFNYHHKEFKSALFDVAKAVAQISDDDWNLLYTRDNKEIKSDKLFGRSPREHMIYTSEMLIKPCYGKDYFGTMLLNSLQQGINIVSDGGFQEEIQVLIDSLGSDNVLIIRIYREGYTFDGDSRDYISDDVDCRVMNLYNTETLEQLYKNTYTLISEYYH